MKHKKKWVSTPITIVEVIENPESVPFSIVKGARTMMLNLDSHSDTSDLYEDTK